MQPDAMENQIRSCEPPEKTPTEFSKTRVFLSIVNTSSQVFSPWNMCFWSVIPFISPVTGP